MNERIAMIITGGDPVPASIDERGPERGEQVEDIVTKLSGRLPQVFETYRIPMTSVLYNSGSPYLA
jgi:hypothetical protein